MTGAAAERLGLLSRLVLGILALLIIAGVVWYGITIQTFLRIWHQLIARPSEPLAFRFILQPAMAAAAAIVRGRRDAKTGRSPYFWAMISEPGERAERLREGLNATARVILLGIVMDVIYQIIVLKRFYPAEAVIVALLLGFVPYLVFRGIATRIFQWWGGNHSARQI